MQALRNASLLARLVLAWFALAIGVAVASPVVKPQGLELLCTGTGAMKLLVAGDDGGKPAGPHTLDCPLCASFDAPAFPARLVSPPALRFEQSVQHARTTRVAAVMAAPLPARGPPPRPSF